MENPEHAAPSPKGGRPRPNGTQQNPALIDSILSRLGPLHVALLLLLPAVVLLSRFPKLLDQIVFAVSRLHAVADLVVPAALLPFVHRAIDAIDARAVLSFATVLLLVAYQRLRIWRFEDRLAHAQDDNLDLGQAFAESQRTLALCELRFDELRAKYRDFVEESQDIVYSQDLEGHFLSINSRGAELLGYATEEFTQLTVGDLVDPAFLPEVRGQIQRMLSGEPPDRLHEFPIYTRDRKRLWVEVRHRVATWNGLPAAVEGIARNVTPRKAGTVRTLLLSKIAHSFDESASLEGALRVVVRILCEELRWEYGEIWSVDEQSGVLRARAIWHDQRLELDRLAETHRARTITRGWGLPGRVWATGEPVRIAKLAEATDSWSVELVRRSDFKTALAIPMRVGSRIFGVALLLSSHERSGDELDPELLDNLVLQLGRIVDRASASEALKSSEARKHAILESALDCVITADHEGRILEFNPAAETTFGYLRAAVLGKDLAGLIVAPEARARHLEAFQASVKGGLSRLRGRRIEVLAMRADQTVFPAELSVTRIEVGDVPIYTAYLRNITERKEVDRLKDELVSTVSHELRTPLTSLRGFVELMMMREYAPDERKRYLGIINEEVRRLTKLIDQFLDLQRLEAGAEKYALEIHDVNELVQATLEVFAANSEQFAFRAELSERPLRVRVDGDRIRQVLLNLLSNAVKYSPDGGTITVRSRADGGFAVVTVQDEGIGMEAETVGKLFTKFYRADSTVTRAVGGTGLGLALVKEILSAHGGAIQAESQPGKGSTFLVTLPLAEVEVPEAPLPQRSEGS